MSYNGHSRSFLIERDEARARKCHSRDYCNEHDNHFRQELSRRDDQCHHDQCHHDGCNNNGCNNETREWNALDASMNHPLDATVSQDQSAQINNVQQSIESIVVKDSCDIEVTSTDVQAALNVQIALQAAIALVISISIADSSIGDEIIQDLNAKLKTSQVNRQQLYIENSRGVTVSTTDTDIAVNVQILLQVLIALVVRLDVL